MVLVITIALPENVSDALGQIVECNKYSRQKVESNNFFKNYRKMVADMLNYSRKWRNYS